MKISYIISAYNEEKYIEQCVHSIFEQKHVADFEVIVVNNNSKDQTLEIVRTQFPEAKVVTEIRQGMTIARNRGAKEAIGNILVFFDADVIVPPHWEGRMLERFSQNQKLAGISGPYRFYDLPKRYKFIEFIDFHILYPFVGELILKKILKKGALWNGGNLAVGKEVFNKVGGFSEEIVFYGEDSDLAKKIMREGEIEFLQSVWVWSSARRLLKGNPVREGLRYVAEYARFFMTNKSREKSYKEVR
ncbi:MAG: glycosyltransferase family A protein [Candidatus Wildermuthbacteria bacterium]|nr:glycosyltransferase family A protein [Candidatus Wildermuthbacteria bacterium]